MNSNQLHQEPFKTKRGLSVGTKIRRLLPLGSNAHLKKASVDGTSHSAAKKEADLWREAPHWPPDIFAVAGVLLEISGAFGFYQSGFPRKSEHRGNGDSAKVENREDDVKNMRQKPINLQFEENSYKKIIQISEEMKSGQPSEDALKEYRVFVQEQWDLLWKFEDYPINIRGYLDVKNPNPDWWQPALNLFVLTDEIVGSLGFPGGQERTMFQKFVQTKYLEELEKHREEDGRVLFHSHLPTITENVDKDIVCVQPKGRIPRVGCTTRVFSKNLSLLRPRGFVRCHWFIPPSTAHPEPDDSLNLLLIPFPFEIEDCSFSPVGADEGVGSSHGSGVFRIEQKWLDESIVEKTIGLIQAARRRDIKKVHGIIFPEYALNYDVFDKLCDKCLEVEPGLEFVVAGSSSNCDGVKGNWVVTRHYPPSDPATQNSARSVTTSRGKHHRWRLDEHQVQSYGLSDRLSPNNEWWENLNLGAREVHIHSLRGKSAYSVLICEDLARSDPCHEIVRSTGANLVFVLLMDGPQIEQRWAALSSSGLAEDPGSSVLTLTCRALGYKLINE